MRETILNLTTWEVHKFRNQLQVQNSSELLALFNLLYENAETFTEKQIEEKIYGVTSGGRRLSMLKNYLKESLLDFLISYKNLHRHPLLDKKFSARIRLKKRIAQYMLLNFSGRNLPLAHKLLDEVIADAKKWEFYPDLIYALDQQKLHLGFKHGKKVFEKWSKEIEHYERCIEASRRAVDHYYKLMISTKFSGNPDNKKVLRIVKEGLKEMKRDYEITNLPVVLYYRQKLETEYYFQHRQYKQAKKVCINTLNLLNKYPAINDSQRTGYAHDYLGQCHVVLGEYKEAREHFRLAQKNILKGTVDYNISQEQEFFLLFYDEQFVKSKQLVQTVLENLSPDTEPFRKGKLNFYIACVLFKLKKYPRALKILRQKTELFKDKAGWMFSSKLVEIMILYEMEKINEMKIVFERLKKFSLYNRKAFTKRDKLLLRLLYCLASCNFLPFGKSKREIQKLVNLLKANRKAYLWQPFSHELIRFELWVQSEFL